jgi:hypothetical protein
MVSSSPFGERALLFFERSLAMAKPVVISDRLGSMAVDHWRRNEIGILLDSLESKSLLGPLIRSN